MGSTKYQITRRTPKLVQDRYEWFLQLVNKTNSFPDDDKFDKFANYEPKPDNI